ncbi:DDE-type integrase/transposase/recombinase [Ixodes scapularis]
MQVKVVDAEGRIVPVNSGGELCTRGPHVFKGYLNDEAMTNEAIRDTWYHTGDEGSMSEDGRLTYLGRIKEMINYRGLKVPPLEIENVLSTHPDLEEAQELQAPAVVTAISEETSSPQQKSTSPPQLDIDPELPAPKRRQLVDLLAEYSVLYKENFSDNSTAWLLVVPSSLQEEIFQACHDDPTAGHLGYSRTLARIREKYYWPKLAKTVHHYTRSCHECQRRKKPPTRPAGLLQPIAPPSAPFQQIGMDLLGPFPPSTQGNRWIIVATDYLTRYAETKALPSGTAVEVAKFFIESIVLRHGAPEVLISDRGSSFMAQLTQEVLRLSHTSHRRTTAYHPQTNGLTERLNKTIADMISMYVDVEHKTWDEVLPYVTFAYNTAVQETTGVTPFQLVHGRKVTTMLDAMLPHEPAVDASDDAQVVAQRAEEVRQLARLRIQGSTTCRHWPLQPSSSGRPLPARRQGVGVDTDPPPRSQRETPETLLWTLQSASSTRGSELRGDARRNTDFITPPSTTGSRPRRATEAVIGVPDEQTVERVCVWIKLKPNKTLSPEDIKAFCKEKELHWYKIPEYVLFVDSFPRTQTGKVQKQKMREDSVRLLNL